MPNFSEGQNDDVIDALARAAGPSHLLDVDRDPDHHRTVISIAASRPQLIDSLVAMAGVAVERIDLTKHSGIHPRVGAADVVPIVPLGGASIETARDVAHEVAERIWTELKVPVFYYGHGEGKRLADIRAGRATPDVGGPTLHPTAGAVSVGARRFLVAFNVILYDSDLVAARALARSIRESGDGMRGVQALAFELPGDRIQLSMNLFRLDETKPSDVVAELERRGVSVGAEQMVGLSPAFAANGAAAGRVLEGRLAAVATEIAASKSHELGGLEHRSLAIRLRDVAGSLRHLGVDQDSMLAAAEQSAALIPVVRAAGVLDEEMQSLFLIAGRGLRAAISPATEAVYRARVDALDARLI